MEPLPLSSSLEHHQQSTPLKRSQLSLVHEQVEKPVKRHRKNLYTRIKQRPWDKWAIEKRERCATCGATMVEHGVAILER
ncbi:putative ethylene-responsive transcription factor [Sesbania bispinosa]|nr:putative ethylene-responsive transcription factor [Sesbania bispinosa]